MFSTDADRLSFRWALICSVPNANQIEQLKSFSQWFTKEVAGTSQKLGLSFDFTYEPEFIAHVLPNDDKRCNEVYYELKQHHPKVLFVLHILPTENSDEYTIMRVNCAKLGIMRQGVLLANALNRFKGVEEGVESVFRNVSQWIARSCNRISVAKHADEHVHDVRIGHDTIVKATNFNPRLVECAVNYVLHGEGAHTVQREESALRVTGIPAHLNDFGIGALFGEFTVLSISRPNANSAIVSFANKFHAFQAGDRVDGKILDSRHTLRVTALDEEVASQLQISAKEKLDGATA